MTPTQIAEKLAIQLVQLPPPELQKTLETEIKANQDAHKIWEAAWVSMTWPPKTSFLGTPWIDLAFL